MRAELHNWELAEAYNAGTLPAEEMAALDRRMQTDPVFAAEFQECLNLTRSLTDSGREKRFSLMLKEIAASTSAAPEVRTIPLRTHYWRTAAIAAGIAILTTLSTFSFVTHTEKKRSSEYSLLKRELETIKRSQNAMFKNMTTQGAAPAAPAKYSGTGFAISNEGYFVTNYHVTEGADSVYIQTNEGKYYKAYLISFDAKTDVAILKVDHKNFRFSKSEVPYTLTGDKRALGTRVFTLGYPQDEIVYNEGYISSRNGFRGDSIQYRLELPAKAGQSGAPVIDGSGHIVGIVTGKESESEGTTYAVGTQSILKLIDNLPKAENIRLPRANKLAKLKREQQIEKLQQFTVAVKVYKN